jgi:hypothetical protein
MGLKKLFLQAAGSAKRVFAHPREGLQKEFFQAHILRVSEKKTQKLETT